MVSVSGVVIFCGDLCGVEEGEEDTAESGLAVGWVVPLLESVDASSGAPCAQGNGWYVSGKRDVGVGGADAQVGADGEVAVGGTKGFGGWRSRQEGRLRGDFRWFGSWSFVGVIVDFRVVNVETISSRI